MGNWLITRRIEAPPERAFEAFTDFDFVAATITAIERFEVLTDGPFRKGTRFRETRLMGRKERTEEMEVTAFDAGRSYTLSANSCGCELHFDHRFRKEGTGTIFELEGRMRPVSLLARLTRPLWGLMRGWMIKCVNKDLDQMVEAIERQHATP